MGEATDEGKDSTRKQRAFIAFAFAGIASELLYLFAWRPLAAQFAPGMEAEQYPFAGFFLLWAVSFLVYFVSLRWARQAQRPAVVVPCVILFAIAFRVTLWRTPLILEDDIYRYLWDGRVTASAHNPFRFSPAEIARFHKWQGPALPSGRLSPTEICRLAREEIARLADEDNLTSEDISRLARLQELSRRERIELGELADLWDVDTHGDRLLAINYPDIPTIYPPFAQFVFAIAHQLRSMDIYAMKAIIIAVDILTVLLIATLLKMLKLDPSLCIIYAWSPLAIKEFANSGHCDAVAVCLVVLAVILILRGRKFLGSAALALGFLAKMFPLLLLPVAWKRIRIRGALVFALIVVVAYVPFAGFGFSKMFQGFAAYADRWEFNSGLFTLCEKNIAERILRPPFPTLDVILARDAESVSIAREINPFLVTKIGAGIVFLVVLCLVMRKKEKEDIDFVRKLFIVLGAMFLLTPVANPWYLCWLLPFLCVFPRRSWLLLTCLVVLAYAYWMPNSSAADGAIWNTVVKPIVSHIPFGPRADSALWERLPSPERNLQLHIWWRTFGVRIVEYAPFYALLMWEVAKGWKRTQRLS